jgi:hypothetical protein
VSVLLISRVATESTHLGVHVSQILVPPAQVLLSCFNHAIFEPIAQLRALDAVEVLQPYQILWISLKKAERPSLQRSLNGQAKDVHDDVHLNVYLFDVTRASVSSDTTPMVTKKSAIG